MSAVAVESENRTKSKPWPSLATRPYLALGLGKYLRLMNPECGPKFGTQ